MISITLPRASLLVGQRPHQLEERKHRLGLLRLEGDPGPPRIDAGRGGDPGDPSRDRRAGPTAWARGATASPCPPRRAPPSRCTHAPPSPRSATSVSRCQPARGCQSTAARRTLRRACARNRATAVTRRKAITKPRWFFAGRLGAAGAGGRAIADRKLALRVGAAFCAAPGTIGSVPSARGMESGQAR